MIISTSSLCFFGTNVFVLTSAKFNVVGMYQTPHLTVTNCFRLKAILNRHMFELFNTLRIQRQLLVPPCDYLHTFPCDYLHSLTGNTAVYLASFTANAAPGIRLWSVDSGSSCFVKPFRDTMILPIKTELQMSVIGGTQSKMVSPLILSFLDADMKYAVLQFQGVFLLESLCSTIG